MLLIQKDPGIERRRKMAEALQRQAMQPEEIRSPWQVAGKLAQAGVGAYQNYKADQEESDRKKAFADTLAKALGTPDVVSDSPESGGIAGNMTPAPWAMPEPNLPGGPTADMPVPNVGGDATPMPSPKTDRYGQIIAALAGNEDTAPYAFEMQLGEIQRQREADARQNELVQVYDKDQGGMVYARRRDVEPGMMSAAPPAGPKEIELWKLAQDNPGFAEFLAKTGGSNTPASLQEWAAFSEMSPEQQTAYLTMKRANPWLDRGDARVLPNPVDPTNNLAVMPKGIGPQRTIQNGQVITAGSVPPSPQFGPQSFPPPAGTQPTAPNAPQPSAPQPTDLATPTASVAPGQTQVTNLPPSPKEERDIANEARAKEAASVQAAEKADIMLDAVNGIRDAMKDASIVPATGTSSQLTGWYSGSNAGKVRSYVATLKSGTVLGAMQRLKQASATGATGFGALNGAELQILVDDIGSLDPDNTDPEVFMKTIDRIEDRYERVMNNVRDTVPEDRLRAAGLGHLIDGQSGGDVDPRPISDADLPDPPQGARIIN